ncbi:MAG: Crp/Fnr family transcriptional regulator [Terrimonas ferruginea]|uniref:Crp/Fnr family transcriptional regulator n=1 Tax=Terrimonas ferruginea TaxID=249 RepID=UPI001AD4FB36|nr:Crp/Fnr family transcriptional regulator [Terrimonas ferruginea]MBN8784393.1 Crp/Fnr family transcriptional regulator [Terrimonas ferruginea]
MKSKQGDILFKNYGIAPTFELEKVYTRKQHIPTMQDILFDFISKYISLTDEEKNAILSLDLFHSVKKGTILLKEGQKSKSSYFVLKGCIRTYYILDYEEKTTAFYTEMEVLTPPCVINKTPSDYYVSCIEDTILTISNSDMEAEVNSKFPKFETMCRILSEELLAKQRMDFDEFKNSSPEERYLNLMQKRPDLIQRVPQHQLASFLGIKPQSLSRLRARIVDKNKG